MANNSIPLSEIIGIKHGKLTPISEAQQRGVKRYFNCLCECGNKKEARLSLLRNLMTKSCGCLNTGQATHGLSEHYLYGIWTNIKTRCLNVNNDAYSRYGGRGIKISKSWVDNPEAFIEWVKSNLGERPEGHSIDRIDNSDDYKEGNLRWASADTQSRNRRSAINITYNGKTMIASDWAKELRVNLSTLTRRKSRGWSDEDIISKPMRVTIKEADLSPEELVAAGLAG